MQFTFTEDQQLFRDTIHSFFMIEATPEKLREVWENEKERISDLWQKIAEQGLLGLSVPEAFGGLGMGDQDWVLMAQEIGYFGVRDSLLSTGYLAVELMKSLEGHEDLKAHWLPKIAQGKARVAVGHPDQPLLADAHVADLLILPHGQEVHFVDPQYVTMTLNPSVDPARRLYSIHWTPTSQTQVANAVEGKALWDAVFNRGAVSTAAQLLGLCTRMIDLSVDYSAERKQFGKPIGSFQAVKHLVANVAVLYEFARPVVYRAAYALQEPLMQDVYVSHAKLAAADAARLAAKNGIQVHGAMGYTWEMDLQIFMKRAWALDCAWGDRGYHKERVAQAIFSTDACIGPEHTFLQ